MIINIQNVIINIHKCKNLNLAYEMLIIWQAVI